MTLSELFEERLSSYEGLMRALCLDNRIKRPIWLAVDEWNVWYRTHPGYTKDINNLEEHYNLEDALMVAMQMNAFIRHASTVKMANIAQIVNVIAPIFTRPDAMFLQTIFYPFENTCGDTALDVYWEGDTFSGGEHTGVRVLDVAATLNAQQKQLVIYVVNRSLNDAVTTTIQLDEASFSKPITASIINGSDIKVSNNFDTPDNVKTRTEQANGSSQSLVYTFEPHSVTALVCPL
jgi:alpha-N-arabinofuranosidase